MGSAHIVIQPPSGISPEQARDARAGAWAYVFECFNRRNGKEGGPDSAPDSPKGGSENDSRAEGSIP